MLKGTLISATANHHRPSKNGFRPMGHVNCLSSGFALYLELTPRLPAKIVDMHFSAKAKTKKRKMKEEDEEKEKEVATIQGRNGYTAPKAK